MTDFPARGQQAPSYWDEQLQVYIDEADAVAQDAADAAAALASTASTNAGSALSAASAAESSADLAVAAALAAQDDVAAATAAAAAASAAAAAEEVRALAAEAALQDEIDALENGKVRGFFYPESYGAVGDGTTDDVAAIQAAIDAANAANGGTVVLTQQYGWTGDILQKSMVNVLGTGAVSFGQAPSGLIALDSAARYRYGDFLGNPYPGRLENVQINGDNIGGGTEQLVRCEAVEGTMRDVWIVNGIADGLDIASSQNCIFDHISVGGFPDGAAFRLRGRADTGGWQGPGGNKIVNSYLHTSNKLIQQDARDVTTFYPHDNFFVDCLFEQYQDDCHSIAHIQDGEIQFNTCVFTGSSGMLTVDADCLLLVENELRPAAPTFVTLTNCYFGSGVPGVSHIIRSDSFGLHNVVRLFGRTQVWNAGQGHLLCDDRGGGGLGVVGGVLGEIDGLSTTPASGVQFATGINGGSALVFFLDQRTPMRFTMQDDLAAPLTVRRHGDATLRWHVDRDGTQRWYDGADNTLRASIVRSGSGLLINGANVLQVYATITSLRPAASEMTNRIILDTTLGILIWSDGTNWRKTSDGTTV